MAQVKKSANSSLNGQPPLPQPQPKVEGPEMEVDGDEKPKENLDWSITPTLCDEDTWFVYSTKEDIEKFQLMKVTKNELLEISKWKD